MAHKLYKVSVPGSLMLLGEHAVLVGKQAVVCAVNKRLEMQLKPNNTSLITISDTRLGDMVQSIDDIQVISPFKFVLSAILLFKDKIPSGFNLTINSEFSSVLGLGSSAAVTVATVAILGQWLHEKPLTKAQVFTLAKQVIQDVQGFGSGADLAASVFGGVLGYKIKPYRYCKLPLLPNLTAVYCGYKTPTVEVIKLVNAAKKLNPKHYERVFEAMHNCVQRAIAQIRQENWPELGRLFIEHHNLQCELGVSDDLLNILAHDLALQSEIFGAKISGSGLGDCVIGLGELPRQIFSNINGVQQFPIVIEQQGLVYVY